MENFLEFYPFDKKIVDFYVSLCEKNNWRIVERFHSFYFCYHDVTDKNESVWIIPESDLTDKIEESVCCSFLKIFDDSIKEYFVKTFTKAMDEKNDRIVFVENGNDFINLGTYRLLDTHFEAMEGVGDIFVKEYVKI